jgi:hypothetical protein
MADLEVPIVSDDIEISAALTEMMRARRPAVVIIRQTGPALFTSDQLLDELQQRRESPVPHRPLNVSLAELEPRTVRLNLASDTVGALLLGHSAAKRGIEAALTSSGAHYAVVGPGAGGLRIVTALDRFGDVLFQTPMMCVCKTDPTHIWRPSDLSDHGTCKVDDSAVDCS